MNVKGTINAGVTNVGRNIKNGIYNCKTDGKIVEKEKNIRVLTREIGNLVLMKLESGDEMSPEIMERYELIKLARAEIIALEENKKKSKVVCKACGSKTSIDMKYCGVCGACLDK